MTLTPQEHYDLAMDSIKTIVDHKDDLQFSNNNAQTLCQAATAHALLGLLRFGIDQEDHGD